jgi:hypothetical protein
MCTAQRWFMWPPQGSMMSAFTGMFGIPLLTEVQVGGDAFRFVVFQTCPAVDGFV